MRKKIFVPILFMGLLLTACGSKSINKTTTETNKGLTNMDVSVSNTNTTTTSTTNKETPDYVDIDVLGNTTDATSLDTSAVNTVKSVYGSVVAIDCGSSLGSGVLYQYNEEYNLSFIITCFHVVDGCTSFSITYNNNTMDEDDDIVYPAKLVGGNSDSDIAVLSIEATDLVYADFFVDSDTIELGSSVVCIGNPLGTLPGSVSSGVVSYVNRKVKQDSYTTRTLIQTDVAINSGNSGGALFNTAGALIGIVNAKYSSDSIEGLGFAIPSNEARSVADSLVDSALYDKANKEWNYGYVEGDFEFGFTLSIARIGNGYNGYYVLYVSESSTNSYYSGSNLKTGSNAIISSITVDYKDETKEDITYNTPDTFSSDTATVATKFLYDANLSVNDKVTFNYSNGNSDTFEIVQYVYSI